MVVTEGDMIRVDEFIHLYRLKKSKEYEYYELMPWVRKERIITDLPSSFRYWKSRLFFVSRMDRKLFLMNFGVKFLGCFIVGEPRV